MLDVYVNNNTTQDIQRKNVVVKIQCIIIVNNILKWELLVQCPFSFYWTKTNNTTTHTKNNNYKGVAHYQYDKYNISGTSNC